MIRINGKLEIDEDVIQDLSVVDPRTEGAVGADGSFGKSTDGIYWVKTGSADADWEVLAVTQDGDFVGEFPPNRGLTIYEDDKTKFGYYPDAVSTVSSIANCDPLYLEGGSKLTDLSFSSCGFSGNFSLSDTSGLTSLTDLSFSLCGYLGFSLDTSGLTSLTY